MTLVLAEDQLSNTNVRLCPLLARKLPDCSRPIGQVSVEVWWKTDIATKLDFGYLRRGLLLNRK